MNCSEKLSAKCIGTNHVILSAIPGLMNSLSSLGTPTYAEKYAELYSERLFSGEAPVPSQPETASKPTGMAIFIEGFDFVAGERDWGVVVFERAVASVIPELAFSPWRVSDSDQTARTSMPPSIEIYSPEM